jgi:hypothetical protein
VSRKRILVADALPILRRGVTALVARDSIHRGAE